MLRLPADHPQPFRFLHSSVPWAHSLFALMEVSTSPISPGAFYPGSRSPASYHGVNRVSRVPGESHYMHAPLFDHGGNRTPCHSADCCCLLQLGQYRLPQFTLISWLYHAAYMLPVYASLAELPRRNATLGSGGGQPCRVGFDTHWIPTKGLDIRHVTPLSRASLGAP